jgi:hypothetical protein
VKDGQRVEAIAAVGPQQPGDEAEPAKPVKAVGDGGSQQPGGDAKAAAPVAAVRAGGSERPVDAPEPAVPPTSTGSAEADETSRPSIPMPRPSPPAGLISKL